MSEPRDDTRDDKRCHKHGLLVCWTCRLSFGDAIGPGHNPPAPTPRQQASDLILRLDASRQFPAPQPDSVLNEEGIGSVVEDTVGRACCPKCNAFLSEHSDAQYCTGCGFNNDLRYDRRITPEESVCHRAGHAAGREEESKANDKAALIGVDDAIRESVNAERERLEPWVHHDHECEEQLFFCQLHPEETFKCTCGLAAIREGEK